MHHFAVATLAAFALFTSSCATDAPKRAADAATQPTVCRVSQRGPLPRSLVVRDNTAYLRGPLAFAIAKLEPDTGHVHRGAGGLGRVATIHADHFEFGTLLPKRSSAVKDGTVRFPAGLLPVTFTAGAACSKEQLMLGAVAFLVMAESEQQQRQRVPLLR